MKATPTVDPPDTPRKNSDPPKKRRDPRLPNPAAPARKHTIPRLHGVNADTDGRVRTGPMNEEDRRLVGKRLRMLRVARALSIDALAHQLGCTPGTISNAESGRWHISVALLDRWLRFLGIDLLTAIGARK